MADKFQITDWECIDLGIDYPDYFQGFGCAFTSYSECTYGIGSDAREALDDALENVAQSTTSVDIEALERDILAQFPDFANKKKVNAARVKRSHGDDAYYHVGIRWNAPTRKRDDAGRYI